MSEGEGGGSPAHVDLTHAFNRIVDSWYSLFDSSVAMTMPERGCAYPGNWDEAERQQAQNTAGTSNSELVWHQAARPTDTMFATRYAAVKLEWDLKVAWQNLEFAHDDAGKIYLIENAIAWVELVKPASLNLKVQGSFGVPTFGGNVAKLPVKFWVEVHDGDTPIRNEYRGFEIHGDGNRVRMF